VLFLTARSDEVDRVLGLEIGGDDYMTKPFSLEELVARIRAILRRVQPASASPGRLAFADLELDDDTHEVWRAGREIELTATEFKLLRYLLLNARRVLSKDQMLEGRFNFEAAMALTESSLGDTRLVSGRQMLSNDHVQYWLEGSVATSVILADHSPSRSYDLGWKRNASTAVLPNRAGSGSAYSPTSTRFWVEQASLFAPGETAE
jgi:hypothetical protein